MNYVFAIACMILGFAMLLFPKMMWFLSFGWKYKNSEPSDAALIFERIGGIVAIILALIIIFNPDINFFE